MPQIQELLSRIPQTTWDTFCPEVADSRASLGDSNQQPQKAMEQLPGLTSGFSGRMPVPRLSGNTLSWLLRASSRKLTQHVQRGPLQQNCHCIKDRWLSLHWSTSGQISE